MRKDVIPQVPDGQVNKLQTIEDERLSKGTHKRVRIKDGFKIIKKSLS